MADRVIIVPYDLEWPALFSKLGMALRQALGATALRIDHIGSTAVPGMPAKPIIDVQVSVASLEPVEPFRAPLASLGYVFRSENPELTKRYFREKPGERRTHIHVRRAGSWSEQFALLFRDYMRAHPEDASRYGDVKCRLAQRCGDDRHGYTEAKAPYLWEIMAKADRWSQDTGWQPGPTDA
jgi:GrpB-like predicted nucleotidyltransferase (UPF0157 family)